MASAVPFSVSSSLTYSPDDGQPDAIHALVGSGVFDIKADRLLNLAGAGTTVITLDGPAKVLFIKVDAQAISPTVINVNINGGSENIEIAPGGGILLFNPVPVVGITSIDIVHTTTNIVHVVALG